VIKDIRSRLIRKVRSKWDSSMDQYVKGDFKIYWELLDDVSMYQFELMTGDRKKFFWQGLCHKS
jgi:hypothetical protein